MKTFILIILTCIITYVTYAQNSTGNFVGTTTVPYTQNGVTSMKTVTTPAVNSNFHGNSMQPIFSYPHPDSVNSAIRWQYTDPVAIGEYCAESGNGLRSVAGWYLNNERTSEYGNANFGPLWQYSFPTQTPLYFNYVAVSDTGTTATGFYNNIYIFDGTGTPFFNFDLTTLSDPGSAGPLGITSNGKFLVASSQRNGTTDTSSVFGFSSDSTHWVWRFKVPAGAAGGSTPQGVRISGNDSLVIVNSYSAFYVLRTYTGQLVFQGLINPISNNGTQSPQGISGNGNVVATINYNGNLRVYQWNGSTYSFVWQHTEPPGTYYNWMSAVDVSYDGSMVACGTLNFITSSTYDGKVKLFRTTNGSTPIWTYSGCGDEVSAVSFSKNGRILSASSWGNYYNPTVLNLLIFKTSRTDSIPWFAANSSGSFFWCSTSNDGTTVFGSGKAVHARSFGSGGIAYNIFVDTAENPTGIQNLNNTIPKSYSLLQNYPNPFNPSTQINYNIPVRSNVKLTVYDIMGREVQTLVNSMQEPGKYTVVFNADNLASGMYFYKIEAGSFTETKKMTLIK